MLFGFFYTFVHSIFRFKIINKIEQCQWHNCNKRKYATLFGLLTEQKLVFIYLFVIGMSFKLILWKPRGGLLAYILRKTQFFTFFCNLSQAHQNVLHSADLAIKEF